MASHDKEVLLREANEFASELRRTLVTTITPADVSPIAKIPFKIRVFRELLLHRVSDLSDAACLLYNNGATIPAFVLTRAAFETMAVMFHFHKTIEAALSEGSADGFDSLVMKSLFGTKDRSTPFEAVNIRTVMDHLEKRFPGLQEMYGCLCEFAHPNYAGVAGAYQCVEQVNLDDPRIPLPLGSSASRLGPEYGLICLRVAISMADWFARELAKKDVDVIRLCEAELSDGEGTPPPAA